MPTPLLSSPTLQRVNYVEFVCGRKGEGKSHLIDRRAARFPRRLTLDYADEYFGTDTSALECLTYADCLGALESVAARGTWRIVANLPAPDMARLCALLSPAGRPRSGVAAALGGVLVECGEVEHVAGHAAKPEVLELIHRGRHSRVSMMLGTRRPRDVHRLVTSQADVISCFRQQEPRDVEYLASVIGDIPAATLATLAPWEHVQFLTSNATAVLVNKDGKTTEVW